MRPLLAAVIILYLVTVATAEEAEREESADWLQRLRLRGRIAEESAYHLHDPGHVSKLRTTGWLEGKYTFSDSVNLRLAARGWYDAAFDVTHRYPQNVKRHDKTELSLREALLSVSKGDLDLQLGLQQIVWGEAISSFVTDIVNPRDFREFILPDFNELRIPIWAVDLTYRLRDGISLEGVWTPDARIHILPKQGAEFQFAPIAYRFVNPVIRPPNNPDEFSLTRSEGGFRLSTLVSGWDMSLIYYDEADKTFVLFQRRRPQLHGPDIIVLEPIYPRLHIVGATISKSIEPVVIRSEMALTIGKRYVTTNPLDRDGVVRRDTLDYLISADYTFFSILDTTLQFGQKILTGSASNLTRGGVEGQVTTSVALRLATGFFDNTLNPTVLFTIDTDRANFRVSPRIDYLLSDTVTVSVGADIFEGPHRTLYGQFDRNDRVYVTTTWRF